MSTHNTREGIEEIVEDIIHKSINELDTKEGYAGFYVNILKAEITKAHHQELQKARHNWLREEIVKLEGIKYPNITSDRDEVSFYSAMAVNTTLQTIIDRYSKELDQPTRLLVLR